jgi:hypothetical protein
MPLDRPENGGPEQRIRSKIDVDIDKEGQYVCWVRYPSAPAKRRTRPESEPAAAVLNPSPCRGVCGTDVLSLGVDTDHRPFR